MASLVEVSAKGNDPMGSRHPWRSVLCAAPALVALILVACGRSPLDSDVEALDTADAGTGVDDSGGLPTKPVDAGLGTKDAGLGTKDAGLGIKDAGLGTADAEPGDDGGSGTEDAAVGGDASGPGTDASGPGTEDGGPGTEDAGMPGSPDAGGVLGCFACAEERCAPLVNACFSSPACVEEGACDLACLDSPPSHGLPGFGGPTPRCFASCSKDVKAGQELLVAVSCAFAACPKECLGAAGTMPGSAAGPVW